LFHLLDDIADTAGVRRLDAVQFSPGFSVTVAHYGFHRKRCLVIGLPLWAAYPPQQRIAAVAHALAYAAPRNVRSRVFVAMVLESLTAGSQTMRANDHAYISWNANVFAWRAGDVADGARRFNMRGRTSEWLLWIPRTAMAATARLLLWLTMPAALCAQLEADNVTARTASSEAAVAALDDQHLARPICLEAHRLVIETKTRAGMRSTTDSQQEFWEKLARHAVHLREQRGSRRSSEPRNSLDAERMERLRTTTHRPAAITLDEPSLSRIANELRLPEQAMVSKMMRDGVAEAQEPIALN
jgi:hypothetical protein